MGLGIVFSGGGARGAYQIGVWKALREMGREREVTVVTGSSVGALNAAMFVQGDLEKAEDLWLRLHTSDILGSGRLEALLESVIDIPRFYASPVEFGLVTVRFPSLVPFTPARADIPPERLCAYLTASSSCPPFFPPKRIGGVRFVDGAWYDNLPLNLAARLGAKEILALEIRGCGLRKKLTDPDIPLRVLCPSRPLGMTFRFSPRTAASCLRLGYLDALRFYGKNNTAENNENQYNL